MSIMKERMEMVGEVNINSNTIRCHEERKTTDADMSKKDTQTQTPKGVVRAKWKRCKRCTSGSVLLLCVLQLAFITVLWTKYINQNEEKNQLQTRYNNLTIERNQLQLQIDQLKKCCCFVPVRESTYHVGMKCCSGLPTETDIFQRERNELLMVLYQLGWRFYESSLYYVSNENKTWTESREECRERGADLVIINDILEQEFINTNFNTMAWIGLTYNRRSREPWQWVDNTSLTMEDPIWYGPNEEIIHQCVITTSTIDPDKFAWTVYPCNATVFSICEKMIN